MAPSGVEALTGTWAYRSFRNNPTFRFADCQQCADLRAIVFGEGELAIEDAAPGTFSGRLTFPSGGQMAISGTTGAVDPVSVRFQGRGISPDTTGFVYDYVAYLVPDWPNGVNQRPALVGSIVRTEPHSGGQAMPGEVASWIAVKRH